MNDLAQHLTENHQFYLALLGQASSLIGVIFIGLSHPPGSVKQNDRPDSSPNSPADTK